MLGILPSQTYLTYRANSLELLELDIFLELVVSAEMTPCFGFRISKKLHESLLLTRNRVTEHRMMERQRMMQEISKMAASARSAIHKKLRESRSRPTPLPKQTKTEIDKHTSKIVNRHAAATGENKTSVATESSDLVDSTKKSITGN